jgi:hypothetical protein
MATDILGGFDEGGQYPSEVPDPFDLGIFDAAPGMDPGTYGEATGKKGYQFGDPDSSSVSASNIFGWTWFGNWAKNTLPADHPIRVFLADWVKKFEDAAAADLTGVGPVKNTDVLIADFEMALWEQPWWKEFDASWQAVQRLRYGTDVPAGEYQALIDSTVRYIGEVASGLGLVDPRTGALTLDLESADIIEFAEEIILNASDVVNGLPSLNSTEANRLIEQELLTERGLDTAEGDLVVGGGSLQNLYNQLKNFADSNYLAIDSEELWDLAVSVKREDVTQGWAIDRILEKVGDQYSFLDGSSILNRITGRDTTATGTYSSLKNHLSPVRTALADTWELGANEVNLQDIFGSDLGSLVTGEGADERFKNSREIRQWARLQPQFKETQGYANGMSNIARSMLQMFGAR